VPGITSTFFSDGPGGALAVAAIRQADRLMLPRAISFRWNLAQRLLYPPPTIRSRCTCGCVSETPRPSPDIFDLANFQIVSASPSDSCKFATGASRPDRSREPQRSPCPRPICLPATNLRQSEKDRAET